MRCRRRPGDHSRSHTNPLQEHRSTTRRKLCTMGGEGDPRLPRQQDLARRNGVLVIEFFLVFMIMLFISIALVVWGIMIMACQAVDSAAAEGARVAARAGHGSSLARQAAAKSAVDEILGAHGMASGDIQVDLDDGVSTVVVTVRVSLEAAGVPDWLTFLDFSLAGHQFQTSALARKE